MNDYAINDNINEQQEPCEQPLDGAGQIPGVHDRHQVVIYKTAGITGKAGRGAKFIFKGGERANPTECLYEHTPQERRNV